MKGAKWIIDGNWAGTLIYRVKRSDTIVLFDFPIYVSLFQYFLRTLKNFNKVRPESGGNIKTRFRWHAIKSIVNYPRKEVNSIIEKNSDNRQVHVLRIRNDVHEFLNTIINSSRTNSSTLPWPMH